MADEDRFEGWFIVELMGRKKTAGWACEQTIAGAGFIRIDVPGSTTDSPVTQFVRPETVYALTPTTEEVARRVAQHYRPEPVYPYMLRLPMDGSDTVHRLPHFEPDPEEDEPLDE